MNMINMKMINMDMGMNLMKMFQEMNNNIINVDLFKTEEDKVHIVFVTSRGVKLALPSPPYITVKELIRNYLRIMGIKEKESLMFIYNCKSIDTNDENPITSIFGYFSTISVIEPQLIGT